MRTDPFVKVFTGQSPEWLEFRRQHLTATEISCLFPGIGFKSAAAIMKAKVTEPELIDSRFMKIGRILEPAVLNAFNVCLGYHVEAATAGKDVAVISSNDSLRLSCSLDGIAHEGESGLTLVEAKTAGGATLEAAKKNFDKWKDGVPHHYCLQVHTQLYLAGRLEDYEYTKSYAYIGVLGYNYPVPFIAYRVHRCEQIVRYIERAAQLFWEAYDTGGDFNIPKEVSLKLKKLLDNSVELIYND